MQLEASEHGALPERSRRAQVTPIKCATLRKALHLKGDKTKLYSSLSLCSLHKMNSAFVTDTQ